MRLYTPLDTPGANWAAATSVALIAQQVAGKAVRDALFLTSFHAHSLPFVMAAAAVLSLLAVVWLTRVMSRRPPAKVLPVLFAASATGFVLAWALGLVFPRASAVLVYFHTALFGATLITTFWSLINERFDPHTAKRAVARIAGGGTLGGVLGGLAAWRASTALPLPALLLFLAALNALAVGGTLLTSARRAPLDRPSQMDGPSTSLVPPPPEGGTKSSLAELRKAPYLRNLALLVAVGSAISTLLDYGFSAQAELSFPRGAPLLYFFSLFWLGVSLVSFVLQVALGRVALERLGLAVSIAVLPGVVLLGGALGLAVPGLVSASLLRGGEAVQRNTLFRSAYELLYTPLSEEKKRSTKAVIDVGFDRVGTIAGSAIVFATLHLVGRHSPGALLGVVVALALATFALARQLHVGYVTALEQSLREGEKKLELPSEDEPDRPSIEHRDRERLIEHVEVLPSGTVATLLDTPSESEHHAAPAVGAAREVLDDPAASLLAASALLSGDPTRTTAALAVLAPMGPAPACAILLLAHPTLHVHALSALRRIAPAITGQLLDALLASGIDFVVRRRIPRVLSASGSQRAADGLLLALSDDRFEVRYQCARALLRLNEASADVAVPRERVIEAVLREVELGKKVLESVSNDDYDDEIAPEDEPPSLMEMLARDRVDRSLEHVFTLLSLHLEREPLRMAFRALHHDDERHRGTALEYLDTMLPTEVRAGIWPYLGATAPLPTARPANELLRDLALAGSDRDRSA